MSIRVPVAVLGALYTVTGLLGFAVGGFHDLVTDEGAALVILRVTPLSSALYLVLGALLMRTATAGETAVRRAALVAGLVLISAGALGPVLRDYLATGAGENALHLATGGAGLLLVAFSARATRRSRPAPGDR